MTLVDLLELAAVVTAHAPLVLRSDRQISPEALRQYWSVCKCRQQRWSRSLKQLRLRPVLEEILATEVLTRVCAAVLTAHDRRRETADAEPIARSVLTGHLEARHRALTLLLCGPGVGAQDAGDLNRLRRQVERWNDMLIGSLLIHDDVAEFAFDAALAHEFADDTRDRPSWQQGGTAWSMVAHSLRAGFQASVGRDGHSDGNDQLAAAILGCLGPDLFDPVGLPRSLWHIRLLHTADRVQDMIEELFAAERQKR